MIKHKITIYTLPTCEFCHMAKAYFKEKGFEFIEVDVDKDPKSQSEMVRKSEQYAVPVIDVDGRIIVGFQKNALEALLAEA